jgi:hypothetical protein
MLNILKIKQNIKDKALIINSVNKENSKLKAKLNKNEYKNIIYYPSSTKEWFNSVYSYNKSYTKALITKHVILNDLFKKYFNMFENKIKVLFKRKRANKNRYSANKIYVSKAELKHTNTRLSIILYIYNKQKSLIERNIRKLINLTINKKDLVWDKNKNKFETVSIPIHKNRLGYIFKRFLQFKKWDNVLLVKNNNILKNISVKIKKKYIKSHKMSMYNRLLKRLNRLEISFINYTNLINFNKSKFSNLLLNLKDLGLISLIEKIYNKNIQIKVVELKSVHLNSDVFSQAVALKLRDRKKKAVRVLRKAIIQMVKIPDFHTLITFYDSIDNINKNNILNVIKQQVVSGVRFEAKGRLTRRLTAMRAIFKYRYTGSLKNVSSSFNNESTTMLRGHVKSNLKYTIINSKTRNGAFGLKGWVSSH